LSAFNFPLKS